MMLTVQDLEARGFNARNWQVALARYEETPNHLTEQVMTLAHPSNWMSEAEVEDGITLDRILADLKQSSPATSRA